MANSQIGGQVEDALGFVDRPKQPPLAQGVGGVAVEAVVELLSHALSLVDDMHQQDIGPLRNWGQREATTVLLLLEVGHNLEQAGACLHGRDAMRLPLVAAPGIHAGLRAGSIYAGNYQK